MSSVADYLRFFVTLTAVVDPFLAVPFFLTFTASRSESERRRLAQVVAPVSRNARIENVMVTALDHIDGIDLHVTQMLNRGTRCLRPISKRRGLVEPLRA